MSRAEDNAGASPEDVDQAAQNLREAGKRAARRVYIRLQGPPQSAVWQPGDTALAELRNAVDDSIRATIAGETDWFVIDSVSSPVRDGKVVIRFWRPLTRE